jgi:deoxyribonuclease-4
MINSGLRIGRHYGGGKDILVGLAQAMNEPASAFQAFAGNPRRYWASKTSEEVRDAFKARSQHLYKVVHCCYITNIAEDPDERAWAMTCHSLVNQLEWADAFGFQSVVFHPGSPKGETKQKGLEWSELALRDVLSRYTGRVQLLLENAASPKKIGGDIQDLVQLCENVDDDRLGVCVDTTHGFASGASIADMMSYALAEHRVNPYLRLIHFNTPDPGVKLGNGLDRHSSDFSDGVFSKRDLQSLYLAFRNLPLILEGTPDLAADVCWFLRWELELRETGTLTPEIEDGLGELFAIAREP